MSKKHHYNVIGARIKRARLALGLSQGALAERLLQVWSAGEERYMGALKFNNTLVSHVEGAALGAKYSGQNAQTVQLLADVLNLSLQEIAVVVSADYGPSVIEIANSARGAGIGALGSEFGMAGVDLPFTPTADAAHFLSGGTQLNTTTLRYVLPPRPTFEYMHNKSRVFEVNDTSMEPHMHLGERLVADPVHASRWELLSNQPVVIGFGGQFAVRMIKDNDLLARDVLVLHPSRDGLAPLTVRRELITCIYAVRESFERKIYS